MRRLSLVVAAALAFLLCSEALAAAPKKKPAGKKPTSAAKAAAGAPTAPAKAFPDEAVVPGATADSTGGTTPPTRGPTRIDFDDRLIQGQTNKSGAVYLYDRKELKTRSMIRKRDSFREEIIGSLYDS